MRSGPLLRYLDDLIICVNLLDADFDAGPSAALMLSPGIPDVLLGEILDTLGSGSPDGLRQDASVVRYAYTPRVVFLPACISWHSPLSFERVLVTVYYW